MTTLKFSQIGTTSSDYDSNSYLIATSTVGSLQDVRFSFAQIAAGLLGSSLGFTPALLSSLPASSASAGARATVIDSTISSTAYGTPISGGGGNTAPVFSDGGTLWRIG